MIKPGWLRKPPVRFQRTLTTRRVLGNGALNTVCRSARCPNLNECFSRNAATFMIMGERCSRNCGFCAVEHGSQLPQPDPDEPARVAKAALELGLRHVVVTSVTRDDLPDGGAGQFAHTVARLRALPSAPTVEVLTPDFQGRADAIDTVIGAGPEVFNHNVETVPHLYKIVRPGADYERSLDLLRRVKQCAPSILTKSGLMLGLGETREQVIEVMKDLLRAGCGVLTIGQYLRPTRKHLPVVEYIRPGVFDGLAAEGEALGFRMVFAGPFVRSSYHAADVFETARG